MGLESVCRGKVNGQTSTGKARLEETDLVFRGDPSFKVPFAQLRRVEARDGALHLEWPDGKAVLRLGDQAARWAEKIRNPPSLLDKLGVKAGLRVAVLGLDDDGFVRDLRQRTDDVTVGRARRDSDLVFVAMSDRKHLPRLAKLRETIRPAGAIWVVWPKGRKEFREGDVRDFGTSAGLVDVKVARFSEALSALKMMIPRALR
jgi:hypothetical protein